MGTDQNGDESGKRMASGGDTLLWRSGICAGKDTWINRSTIRFGWCKADVHRTLCPRQGARGLLMDGTAVESAFAFTFDKSNKTAVSGESFLNIAMFGVNKNYVPYLALKQKRGEKIYDEKNNQWYDRSWFTGS